MHSSKLFACKTHTVFYTDISDGPNPDPYTLAERLVNQNSHATLIVDNCPPDLHNRLVAVGGNQIVC